MSRHKFIALQPGEYEFMCGMKMNRGVIEVHTPQVSTLEKAAA